jgi:hypothetical protein
LLTQKIKKEQFVKLSTVNVNFRYNDNTSRTVNTIESIEQYIEHRDVNIERVAITWNFILDFPDKDIKHQKILLIFDATNNVIKGGGVYTIIEHNNGLWASEIISLFSEQLNTIRTTYSKFYQLCETINSTNPLVKYKNTMIVGILFSIAIILPILIYSTYLTNNIGDAIVSNKFSIKLAQDIMKQDFKDSDIEKIAQSIALSNIVTNDIFNKQNIEGLNIHKSFKHSLEFIKDNFPENKPQNFFQKYNNFAFLLLAMFLYAFIFQSFFKKDSMIAITSKDIKQLEIQERYKSNIAQIGFGILSSIIGTLFYTNFL